MFIHQTPAAFYGRNLKMTSDILEKWFVEFQGNLDDFQKYLLEQTFDNSLFLSFSIRIKYRELTLKTIVKWIGDRPVNERWYELIVDLASRTTTDQDWCQTIYLLTNDQVVIHRQTTALLSHGLTGLSSWPASITLGDFLMEKIDMLSNKRIIELGAGSGLLGLSLLKYSSTICRYKFTDYSPMILNLLQQNISLNFSDDELKRIETGELDWNDSFVNDQEQWDLILATDVVYDPSVIESLVRTIHHLLELNRSATVYIANVIRNPLTYEQFRECLNATNIQNLIIDSVHYDQLESIEILRICRSN